MITIKSNIGSITENIRGKLKLLLDREYLLRPVCFDVIDLMTKRIHIDGLASDGAPIGSYSSGYLKTRKEKFNRSSDRKVIISLSRQLENDWSVIATPKGYGIGFLNQFNMQKARWTEGTYDKKIFSLSQTEHEYAIDLIRELTSKALQS